MLKAQFRKARKGQQGFTLLEVLIVVGIMGLLAAMVWPMKGTAWRRWAIPGTGKRLRKKGWSFAPCSAGPCRPSMLHGGKSS